MNAYRVSLMWPDQSECATAIYCAPSMEECQELIDELFPNANYCVIEEYNP